MSNKLEAEEEQEKLQQKLIAKMDTGKFTAHRMTVAEALKKYSTNLEKGLTNAEATKRLAEYGLNELDAEEEKSLWERIVEQFEDVLVRILLASATISFVIAITGTLNLRELRNILRKNLTGLVYENTDDAVILFEIFVLYFLSH